MLLWAGLLVIGVVFRAPAWWLLRTGRSIVAVVFPAAAQAANLVLLDHGVSVSARLLPTLTAGLVASLGAAVLEKRMRRTPSQTQERR